jgi:hypothetical protein
MFGRMRHLLYGPTLTGFSAPANLRRSVRGRKFWSSDDLTFSA